MDVVHGSSSSSPISVTLPPAARHLRLSDLQPSTEYTICITLTRTSASVGGTYVCTSVWTNEASEQPPLDEYMRLLAVILGSIFGATLLIVVVAVVVVLLRRYCARRARSKAAALSSNSAGGGVASRPRSTSTRPRVGFGSKRFAKDGGGAAKRRTAGVATVSGGGQGQTTSAAFTPDERAQILAMLADTPAFTAPRAFSNAAYDPGFSEFAAELNQHVYDAIGGGEGLYDVPLDSPV